jgi:outer membrane murein-binding lipoprotein Lpp
MKARQIVMGAVVLGLAALMLPVNGCESDRKSELEAQVRALVEETGNLKAQIKAMEQERSQLEREAQDLVAKNAKLKERVDTLTAEATAAKEEKEEPKKLETEIATGAVAEVPADADTQPQERAKRIAEITKATADLKMRQKDVGARINMVRAEVARLTKATVDTPVQVPTGCFVEGGNIYRRTLICGRREVLFPFVFLT